MRGRVVILALAVALAAMPASAADPEEPRQLLNAAAESLAKGAAAEAFRLASAALRLAVKADDVEHEAEAHAWRALALRATGDVEEAWREHDRAAEQLASEALSQASRGRVHRALGEFSKEEGRYVEALEHYLEHVRSLGRPPQPPEEAALSLVGAAYCSQALGRPAEGLKVAELALKALQDREGPAVLRIRARAENVAGVCDGQSVDRFRAAEKTLRELCGTQDHPDLAMVLHNLALGLLLMDSTEEAERTLAEAFAMNARLFGKESLPVALDWGCRGALLLSRGEPLEASRSFGRALAVTRELRHPYTYMFATAVGIALEIAGRAKEAIPYYEEAAAEIEAAAWRGRGLGLEEQAQHLSHLHRPEPHRRLALLLLREGRAADAVEWIERGRARALLGLLARCRIDLLEEAERRAREQEDERTVTRIGLLREERADIARGWSRLGRDDTGEGAPRVAMLKLRRRRQRAARERARLVRDVVPTARPATATEFQRLLRRGERVLYYVLAGESADDPRWLVPTPGILERPPRPVAPGAPRGAASRLTARSVVVSIPPTGEKIRWYPLTDDREPDLDSARLASKVSLLRRVLSRHPRRTRSAANGRDPAFSAGRLWASRLAACLLPAGLRRDLQGVKRVYVVPQGSLYRLPFEALAPGSRERTWWFDDGPEIAYVPSGSVLLWCLQRRDVRRRSPAKHALVAVGDCRFADHALHKLTPLPGTRAELDAINAVFGDERLAPSVVLQGEAATEARLFELAPTARYLHIATHQVFGKDTSLPAPRLALTPPEKPGGSEDGFLDFAEVLETWRDRLSACELVTLSACESGKGPIRGDEPPLGMPVGFLHAGAPACIASLWRVDDKSTAKLFADFYRRLRSSERPDKLTAFTEARRALKKEYPSPYHWAAFVYIGDPR